MFKIVANPTFTRVVHVQVPVDGGFRDDTVKATYRVLPSEEIDAFNLESATDSSKFLQAALVQLDDLTNEAGAAVPYSDEVRDQVLRFPYVRLALATAYFDAVTKVKTGN
jgi:hypothetical protein